MWSDWAIAQIHSTRRQPARCNKRVLLLDLYLSQSEAALKGAWRIPSKAAFTALYKLLWFAFNVNK